MDGYVQISLSKMISAVGEDKAKAVLSSFSCPLNKDVEDFLRHKAVVFSQQSIAETHLVFASHKGIGRLIAYYTIAMKSVHIPQKHITNTLAKKINKFGVYDRGIRAYIIPSVLIAQLSKNYDDGLENMISGDELIRLALDRICSAQEILGGKLIYVECEDKPSLTKFYSRHGFIRFGTRNLDRDEEALLSGEYLVQMLKYGL